MKLTVLALSIFFCIVSMKTALAQSDYIVTIMNDTLRGEIKKSILTGKYRFTETGKSNKTKINIKNTSAYHRIINDKRSETYVAKLLPEASKPIFLELLEEGKIQLHQLIVVARTQYATTSTTTWYASKDDGKLLIIKTTALSFARAEKESNFKELLSDNPELWSKFKAEKEFSFDMLRNYIQLYNQEQKTKSDNKTL